MKKIISDEIRRLEKLGDMSEASLLEHILEKHPALDYADELLDGYSRMTNHYHSLGCGDEECMPLCKEAQALIKEIEGKK